MTIDTSSWEHEGQLWDFLHGDTDEARGLRERSDATAKEYFGENAEALMRAVLIEYASGELARARPDIVGFLHGFHPRAVQLLLVHGTAYVPHDWGRSPREWERQPVNGKCHENSHWLMCESNQGASDVERMVYVEGLALSTLHLPMLHAWNARGLKKRIALDWTSYSIARWTRHFGIPFTESEYATACRLVSRDAHPRLLLSRSNFGVVEKYLNEVLQERKRERPAD